MTETSINDKRRCPRKSNFELLRILAILMVVMGHFIRQSGLLESEAGTNAALNIFLGSGGRIAVNIFLLIGSWFMVDSAFRPSKALKLYIETAFYCIPLTLVMACLGTAGEARNVLQGFMPFFGRPVWFATAYISLILLTPFLNMAFLLPPKRQFHLASALFVLFCLVSTVPSFSNIDYIADFSWFCVLYIIVGWAKGNNILEKVNLNKWVYALMAILIYAGMCLAARSAALGWVANYWLDNIRTLPNVACALCLFMFFRKIEIGSAKVVNLLARSIFAVYVVHQIPAFREFEWKTLCQAETLAGLPPTIYAISIVGISLAVFLAITAIDAARLALFSAVESKFKKAA